MRANRSLYLLSLLVISLTGWSYFTHIDVAIRSRGIVRPANEVVKAAAEQSGLISRISISEGSPVHRGDILLQLDERQLRLKEQSVLSQIHYSELRLSDLDERLSSLRTLNATASHVDAIDLAANITATQSAHSQARSRLLRISQPFDQGLASRQSLEEARSDLSRAEADANRYDGAGLDLKRAQAGARLQELASDRTPLRATLTAAYKELDQIRLELTHLTITSPVSGRIASVAPLHAGESIAAGALIATILPDSEPLIIESWLSSPDRAFVNPGQTVRLRLESTSPANSQTFNGLVASVSPDVRINDSGLAAYRVVVTPLSELKLGATFDVHFITREERLLFLLFQRIRREFEDDF